MTSMTQPAEDISGDSSTSVPNTSRYRFFSLYRRIKRSGLNMTTMNSLGAMLRSTAPTSARSVTLRSNTFQPLSKYAVIRMEPPIHTEYFLSGGAMILILMVDGARAVISFCILSAIPGYMVVPPDMTVLAYRSLRMSTSHFMMELYTVSWIPQDSPRVWWLNIEMDAKEKQIANEHQQLTQSHEYKAGWSFFLVLAGVVTTIGSSLPVGYNIGVVNTPAEIIKTFCNESFVSRYNLPLNEAWLNILWSSVVSIFIVGGCTGSVLGSVLADKLGRKNATIATSALFIAGAVFFLFCRAANSVEMLVVGRLLVGLAGGLTTSIVPMYLTELSPPSLTGAMGVACPMGVNVGVLVGQVMGLNFLLGGADDWPYLLSVYAVLVIVCLPVLYILPESPKYLFIVKKNEIAAMKELSRLRGVSSSVLTEDLEAMRQERLAAEAAASSGESAWSMARVAADPRLRLPLLLACSTQAGQQTSGINAVFYYSQTIFIQAGLSVSGAQYATIGCGFINVCTAALMPYLLPRKGRRPLLLGSALCATIFLATLAAAMTAIEVVSWMPYVCTIAVLLYVLVYGFGLGPIPYFIASEMFEVGPRPAAMAWGSLANWGGNFLVGLCFPTMRRVIGPYSFLVFSAITGALFLFVRKYFPETRGSTPAQVTERCSQGLRSRPLRHPDLQGV